jgi:tRNA dimethylallyltransferase
VNNKTVILLTGPTASGKTSMAIELAQKFHTSIISADSRQCYREMNIGVAKPSAQQLAAVHHYFINSHSIFDPVNAATFAQAASQAATDILSNTNVAIMTGGTGLYIKAFLEGLDDIPSIPDNIHTNIAEEYEAKGITWLQEQLKEKDPLYYSKGEIMNPQRSMRALEVKLATGRSIKEFYTSPSQKNITRDYSVLKFAIDIPREELYDNINNRTHNMIEEGLLEEVRSLLPHRKLNALQTVGYNELFDYIDGKLTLSAAVDKIKQNTRNYAKRQLTWFRKDKDIRWIRSEKEIYEVSDLQ